MSDMVLIGPRVSNSKGWSEGWSEKMTQQRTRYKLSAAFVKSAPVGKHNDGDGLWLHKHSSASAKWFFRFTLHRRRREMGLGSLSDVSLQMAREFADEARELVKRRVDPIRRRDQESRDASRTDNSLKKIAEEAFEARKADLRDDGIAGRWFSPLELHVLPRLRKPVCWRLGLTHKLSYQVSKICRQTNNPWDTLHSNYQSSTLSKVLIYRDVS